MPVQRKNRRSLRLSLALSFAALPNQIGFQDLGALLARHPEVTQRWRAHVFASPPAFTRASMFSLPRPLGTAIPQPPAYVLASVDPNAIGAAIGRQVLGDVSAPLQFPSVNRKSKGDALVARPRRPMPPRALTPDELVPEIETEASFIEIAAARVNVAASSVAPTKNPSESLLFKTNLLGSRRQRMQPWAPGAAPRIVGDPDIKLAALASTKDAADERPGESIAAKGEVTGPDRRPRSPAERLSLHGSARAKAERCLANAVYFEARDEPVRAQIGVAQVVLNRALSPYYPNNVCDVVYQNAHRRLACQFTFACDGKRDVVTESDAWQRATRIAADMLDGKLWMPEVAKSTHYHDDWAHPNWVREMRRLDKQGGLIFYRPRNWGDGSEEPKWGDPKTTAKTVAKL
jgi:spore germination cell wall hydrolase CwlJ-like protein